MQTPAIGSDITVSLPGERLRATVRKIVGRKAVLVELTSMPMTKGHMFRLGDLVPCVAGHNGLEEIWEAMDDRRFLAMQAMEPEKSVNKGKARAAGARK